MSKDSCVEKAKALRSDPNVHYNCAQAALCAFSEETGLGKEDSAKAGAFFGSGMRCGSVCGAITGALMALGLCGAEDTAGPELLRRFRAKNGALECKELLKAAAERGEEKKPHCDRMICDAVELASELMEEKKR